MGQIIYFGLLDAALASLGAGPNELRMLRETTFTPILLAVLLAHILHSQKAFEGVARMLGHRMAPLWLAVALIAALMFMPADLRGWPRLTLHLLMMGLLASSVVREDHVLAPLLKRPGVVRIGVLSYGMYLRHVFVVHFTDLLAEHGLPDPFRFPLAVLGTIVVAELSYGFYETPFLRLKARFAR